MAVEIGGTGGTPRSTEVILALIQSAGTTTGAATGEYRQGSVMQASLEETAPKTGPIVGIFDPEFAALLAGEI